MGENDQPAEPGQGGVFGNLPHSRPGTRSPRRTSGARPREAGSGPGAATEPPAELDVRSPVEPEPQPPVAPRPQPMAEPQPKPVAERAGAEQGPEAEPDRSGDGLEELAWAGVAAAAEAATIGVRLASRAMEALRDSVERR
jgi:hypothetical protein